MADITPRQVDGVPRTMQSRYVDMGDGTHALVVYDGSAGEGVVQSVDVVTATPTGYSITLTLAATEYSQALPANCRLFEFQCRTGYDIRWATVTGRVAGPVDPYRTLKSGAYYFSPAINQGATPSTLYFASAEAGVVVELLAWT